ncbi:MAG TPA: pyridoxal-phosphate dependent enzyme, partial [Cytophagales bacterium]|nr:pyridoxal-phosphate dependent enzyme [Cytophagales bacterium]
HTPVQELVSELSLRKSVRVYVKRDDLLDPWVMGNKWRKLKYNVLEAYENGFNTLLTFGGAYSNHILATAAAGKHLHFNTIGVIRGEELHEHSNETLSAAHELGMRFHFVNRDVYRMRTEADFHNRLRDLFGRIYIIPEGGNNAEAIKGVAEMVATLPQTYDYYTCSCGTGSTAAGIASKVSHEAKVVVFPALHQVKEQRDLVRSYSDGVRVVFSMDYVFGGYAKHNEPLSKFMQEFPLPLDTVYTSKLFYGVYDLLEKDYFASNSSLLIYHSGGYRVRK